MSFRLNAAHSASFSRVLMTPFLLIYLTNYELKSEVVLGIVILAALSDMLDGYLARKFNSVTRIGAFIDFTADKIFVNTILIIFSITGDVPLWMTLLIINRDFWVMGIRIFSAGEGFNIPSSGWGKLKTVVTFMAIIAVLLGFKFSYWLFLIAVILTTISWALYTASFIKVIRDSDKVY